MKEKIHLIITGGSSGLGREIVNYYSKKVSQITIIDKKKSDLKKINFINLDLTKVKEFNLVNEKFFSYTKIVIINAAVQKLKKNILFEKKEDLDKAFSISVSSPFALFKNLIIKAIEKKIYCKYIDLGSVLSNVISPHQTVSYHLAKSGSLQLSRILSIFFRSKYFTSTSIKIGFFSKNINKKNMNELFKKHYKKHQDLSNKSKDVSFENIIETINFIIKNNHNYLNGAEISVDQGISHIEQFYIK